MLDLEIQDIVRGEINKEDNNTVVEVVRIVKLQGHERRRKDIKFGIGIISFLYVCILGNIGLFSHRPADINEIVVYGISYFIVAFLILCNVIIEKEVIELDFNKKSISKIFIPAITYLCEIVIFSVTFSMVEKGKIPFAMEPYSIGPFLNTLLKIVFLLNILFVINTYYKVIRYGREVSIGIFISFAVLFLSGLNGYMLGKLSGLSGLQKLLWNNVGVISAEMLLFIIVGVFWTKKHAKEEKQPG